MRAQKERRIKYFRKRAIWPRVIGLVFLLVFFCLIGLGILAGYMSNLFEDRYLDARESIAKLAESIDSSYASMHTSNIDVKVEEAQRWDANIQEVHIIDPALNSTYHKGDTRIPEDDLFKALDDDYDFKIYLLDNSFVFWENSDLTFSFANLTKEVFDVNRWLEAGMDEYNLNGMSQDVFGTSAWINYVGANSEEFYVLYNIGIRRVEYATILGIFVLAAMLVVFVTFIYIILIIRLIADRNKAAKMVYTDFVTGGNNWTYFITHAAKKIRRNRNNKKTISVVLFRFEKYRGYFTSQGADKGEELIETMYYVIKQALRRNDIVAYHEKADFAVMMYANTDDEIVARVDRILADMEKYITTVKPIFTVGICKSSSNLDDPAELYNNAVLARGSIGESSVSTYAWFTEDMRAEKIWEHKVEEDIDAAFARHELVIYLQPKYSTGEEKLAAAEALVRWQHPTEGFLSPYKFIPILEQNGYILKLDDYMVEGIAMLQAKWIAEGKKVVPISVNVSRAHFLKEDLAEHIRDIIDKYNVPHDCIELELTESAFFDDKKTLLSTVKKMREYGFAVSMDDFGAGYSSLNSLKEMPLDIVKLDAEFFRGEDNGDRGKIIIEETISLAKKLDMSIVAEGIETREQVDFLTERECDLIQGYYFAKPLPIDEFEKKAFG